MGEFTVSNIKTYVEATGMKTALTDLRTDIQMDENAVGVQNKPVDLWPIDFCQKCRGFRWGKDTLFNHQHHDCWDADPTPHHIQDEFKMNPKPTCVSAKARKVLKGHVMGNLRDLELGKMFRGEMPKVGSLKENVNWMIENKSFVLQSTMVRK